MFGYFLLVRTMNIRQGASLGSFIIFQVIRTSIAKEPFIFVIVQGGSEPPVYPSASAHDAILSSIVSAGPIILVRV